MAKGLFPVLGVCKNIKTRFSTTYAQDTGKPLQRDRLHMEYE